MSDPFPLELVDAILSNLSGTSSLVDCALVCRSWVPSSRYHLLPHPLKVLDLRQNQIVEFLNLINSPHSTLSLLSVSTLHLDQYMRDRCPGESTALSRFFSRHPKIPSWITTPMFRTLQNKSNPKPDENDKNPWLKCTSVSDFLVTNPLSVSTITSLCLEWLDWKTLTPLALASLQSNNYSLMKELNLQWIVITFEDICNLISGFPVLEKFTIGKGLPYGGTPWNVDSVRVKHRTLSKIVFEDRRFPWVVQAFSRGIEYTSGIVEISVDMFTGSGRWKEFEPTCGELLEVAGVSLQVLRLYASDYEDLEDTVGLASISNFLAFPRNINLQEIYLEFVNETVIKSLLKGFKSYPKPNLRRLSIKMLEINYLDTWEETWSGFDTELSKIPLSLGTPTLVLEFPLHKRSDLWWVHPDEPGGYVVLDEEEVSSKIRGMLPRIVAAEHWKLELQFRRRS